MLQMGDKAITNRVRTCAISSKVELNHSSSSLQCRAPKTLFCISKMIDASSVRCLNLKVVVA